MGRIGAWLVEASRWGLLAALVYAPLAYGCTRDWAAVGLDRLLYATAGVWVVGFAVERRLPRIGVAVPVTCALLAALGWGVTGIGFVIDAWDDDRIELSADTMIWLRDFGSMTPETSARTMLHVSAMLLAFLAFIEAWKDGRFARRAIFAIAGTGMAVVALGLLGRTAGRPFVLFTEDGSAPLAFGTYRYWGNAAAYLNLVWPLIAAMAADNLIERDERSIGTIWTSLAVLAVAACFINPSKAGNVLAVVGLGLMALLIVTPNAREIIERVRQANPLVAVAVAAPVLIMLLLPMLAMPWRRWAVLVRGSNDPRLDAYRAFAEMAGDAGWTGFGPGAFAESSVGYLRRSAAWGWPFWVAHQDYLQTVIDWGWIGGGLWALLVIVCLVRLLATPDADDSSGAEAVRDPCADWPARFASSAPRSVNRYVRAAFFTSAALVALHALADFPLQIPSIQLYFLAYLAAGAATRSGPA